MQLYLAAITMSSISIIFKRITHDFSGHSFETADSFYWSASKNTVFHPPINQDEDIWCLLHEIAHGQLGHSEYSLDIELIKQESAAWNFARRIAQNYCVTINDDFIQDYLDTYRSWLYARSKCPKCKQNGIQTQNTYRCINCRCLWRANEARLSGLKRTKLPE